MGKMEAATERKSVFKDSLSYRVLDVMSEITFVYETYW